MPVIIINITVEPPYTGHHWDSSIISGESLIQFCTELAQLMGLKKLLGCPSAWCHNEVFHCMYTYVLYVYVCMYTVCMYSMYQSQHPLGFLTVSALTCGYSIIMLLISAIPLYSAFIANCLPIMSLL